MTTHNENGTSKGQDRRPAMGPGSGRHRRRIESAKDIKGTLKRLAGYLRSYKWQIILASALVLVSTFGSLAGPALVGRAIDAYILPGDMDGLLRLLILMGVVYAAGTAASIGQTYIMTVMSQQLIKDIRSELFTHMQTLSMRYHDRHDVGDMMSRLTSDTDTINQVLSSGVVQLVTNALSLSGTLVAMVLLSWQLAILTLILLPVMLFITGKVTQKTRNAFRDMQFYAGQMSAVMEENISGVHVVQAFAHEDRTIEAFRAVNADSRDAGTRAEIITAALGPMFSTMSAITIALVAWLGGWLALQGLVAVGVITTFVLYIRNFFSPLRSLAMLYNTLQSAIAGAERIFEVIDTQPEVKDAPGAEPLPAIEGHVAFKGVSFAYEPGKPVLTEVDLEAKPGQTIALVGPTGAGKTTIVNLLSRFYDVDAGTITIDGHDLRDVQQASIRSQLGIVLQDTFLFSGTVMENIRYGWLDATDEEVVEAAKIANADRFIRLLPEGYETPVSEQGSNFSQGQRQLIAIARAVLADPRILILDEATSSVDTRTEMHIQEALLRLMEGRTAFVIAHRLSTIREADEVLVINDHRIIERGSHDELLAMQGFYHNLYMSQFRRAETLAATV